MSNPLERLKSRVGQRSSLPDPPPPEAASKNIEQPEVAPRAEIKPVQASPADVLPSTQKVRPGHARPSEARKGASDLVDWRALNATERWVQLSTRVTYECNDKIRRIAVARRDRGVGRRKLCEILEDMADLLAECEGVK